MQFIAHLKFGYYLLLSFLSLANQCALIGQAQRARFGWVNVENLPTEKRIIICICPPRMVSWALLLLFLVRVLLLLVIAKSMSQIVSRSCDDLQVGTAVATTTIVR